jgi:hypothetical protein
MRQLKSLIIQVKVKVKVKKIKIEYFLCCSSAYPGRFFSFCCWEIRKMGVAEARFYYTL